MSREERIHELANLHPALSTEVVEKIYNLELQLQSNNDLVIELLERNIIAESEITEKIDRCFQVFLKDVVNTCGEDICKDIYDYLPGEKIGFLNEYKPSEIDGVHAIEVASIELFNAIEVVAASKLDLESRHRITATSRHFKALSSNIVGRVYRRRAMLAEITNELDREVGVIKAAIDNVDIGDIEVINTDIEAINIELEEISHRFIESEAE
ncbi:hypothetical protein L3V35_09200 [Vibrio sp. L5-1]|uniref:hypothetical protein n=1 Tax=Vibrio sp. L5-1 TaxID=2912254 RepID=UPI001F39146D|nr:hypothetical protein [Vibrio sp. L5-1]MCF7495225.1 hypothetical protein [Vibrio sp. L5-1]